MTERELRRFRNNEQLEGYYTKEGTHLTKPLQKYHNKIKSILIDGASDRNSPFNSLLDLSCGRGGDIWKWQKSNYRYILGVDIDKTGIEINTDRMKGAKARYEDAKVTDRQEIRFWAETAKVNFAVVNTGKNLRNLEGADPEYKKSLGDLFAEKPKNSFNVVSSQFTIHYYFKTQQMLEELLKNVKENIKLGGYFLVTTFDGDRLYDTLKREYDRNDSVSINGLVYDEYNREDIEIWNIKHSNICYPQKSIIVSIFIC